MNLIPSNSISAHDHSSTDGIEESHTSFLAMLEKTKNKEEIKCCTVTASSKQNKCKDIEQGADMLLLMKKSPSSLKRNTTLSLCQEVKDPQKQNNNKESSMMIVQPAKKKKRTTTKCQFRIKGEFYVKGNKVITEKDKLCRSNAKTSPLNCANVRCDTCFKRFCHPGIRNTHNRNCFEKHMKQWENEKCENATFTIISRSGAKE